MSHRKNDLDNARDDLLSHIHRCGVLKALPEDQIKWLDETIEYLGECYPELNAGQLTELKEIGVRFCQPVIPHGKGHTALTVQEGEGNETQEGGENEGTTEEEAGELASV